MTGFSVSRSFDSLRLIAGDIKIAHSVFALPFALLAACMAAFAGGGVAADGHWRFVGQLLLIVAAMVFARTLAMLANRLIDHEIDRHNPRTARRAIPSGKLTPSSALVTACVCAAMFMAVCIGFGLFYANWWPATLGLPVLVWISMYGYFKRFTSLSHLYLGSSLAISPVAAALAIEPGSLSQPAIWLLAAAVLCWVAGFDVIYALQDEQIDREQKLFSLPATLGRGRALLLSRILHAIASGCLLAIVYVDLRLDVLFAIAVALVIGLLIYEHATVQRWGTTRIALAFFTLNGIISCLLGAAGILDILFK